MSNNNTRRITWEGCSVLLDINDGERLIFARLTHAATVKINKKDYSLKPVIGCPFGSLFLAQHGPHGLSLSRVLPSEDDGVDEHGDNVLGEDNLSSEERRDNRAIVDNNTAQSLTGEDIEELRRQGATGDQIVEALIANSATFEKKTTFSQEKYRIRKQKKYAPRVLIRRPFVRSISDFYFKKYPAKVSFLRSDSLSLLLSMANITAHSDVLVVDMVGGLVTGAVAERLGGTGHVCNMHLGVMPHPLDIVRMFNFDSDICERIVRCCLDDLCLGKEGSCEQVEELEQESSVKQLDGVKEEVSMEENGKQLNGLKEEVSMEETGRSVDMPRKKTATGSRAGKSIQPGGKASEELINSWKEKGFPSLIIAARELDVWSIMQKLIPILSHSASFAIYHQYLQPLATCMHNLQREKIGLNLQISEPWLREYQVLPSRTHPHMQMSATGGYVLCGTKICRNESDVL